VLVSTARKKVTLQVNVLKRLEFKRYRLIGKRKRKKTLLELSKRKDPIRSRVGRKTKKPRKRLLPRFTQV
jgi:hypothetical protein